MHEASLVQGLLKIVLNALEENQEAGKPLLRVQEIICEAGLLACFEENTLRACFEIFAEGTAAEKARLTIRTASLDCECGDCGANFKISRRHFICPCCSSENIKFEGGNGLVLQAINVEYEEEGND